MAACRERPVRRLLSLLVATVMVAVAACSAPGGSGATPDHESSAAAGLEKGAIRVGMLPIVDAAYLQRAQVAGYFAAEGLTVELVTIQGGAAAVPQLVTGELDMTFTNNVSLLLAQFQKTGDFRFIDGGYQAGRDTFLVMADPGSAIRSPRDLAGKRVAVNTFKNIAELTARSALEVSGVASDSVTFVSIPFPDMAAALRNRQVDAAVMVEPYITDAARSLGAINVLDTASGPTEGIAIGGVGTTASFVRDNPRTVAAFRSAVARAQAEMSDRSVVERTLPTYTRITPDIAPLISLGTWPAALDRVRLQRDADLMRRFGMLTDLDVGPMILPPS